MFDELLAEAAREPPLLIPGTRLSGGRFVIRSLLGTGGMGAVYRAVDTRRGPDVAIKVLSRVEAAGVYALKREFRALSSVAHPNLVSLYELHSDRGSWFFTMELVTGTPLSQVSSWTTSMVRDVFGQIAGAIQAIHGEGKLHRDLKPSNIMLTPEGRVVVLDFGLVSDQEPGGVGWTLTDDGLSGTPAYMAPEQATGEATPQSDWYAFGTMLYEALFSASPFQDKGVALLVRKREEPASPPPRAIDDVPEALRALCMGLLDRDASKRPGFAEVVSILGRGGRERATATEPAQEPFVGREDELGVLEQALLETDQGRSVVCIVSGCPGIGKTRLVTHFSKSAEVGQGAVVLAGRCPRWEHIPFRACDSLIDELSRYLRALPIERAATMLPRSSHALSQLFPALGRLRALRAIKPRRALPRERSELKRLGLAALRDLVGNIAAQERLVIFVDDMQWSDLDGARLLASLVAQGGQLDAPAMLLVIAHRTQDEGDAPGLSAFLERLASSPDLQLRRLRLRELSAAESRQLAARLLDGVRVDVEARIARETDGNPLFIRQLIRHLLESDAASGTLDLEGVLGRRVAALSAREREILAAICLTSRPLSLELLTQITEQPDPEPVTRRLEAAQLVRLAAGPGDAVMAFHDRVREAVLQGLDAETRTSLHARAVEALERMTEPDLAALTLHYLGSGREEDGAACAVKAARQAAAALSFEQAAAMYRLALDLGRWERTDRVELLVELAEILVLDRRSVEAGERFLQAASLESAATERRALRLRAADHFLAGGWLSKGIELLREVFIEVGLDYEAIRSSDLFALRRRVAEGELTFAPRPEGDLDPETLARLDVLAIAGNGLAWLKPESLPIRFVLALEARDAREPLRYALGLRTVARFDAQLDPDNHEVDDAVRRICDENPGARADLLRPGLDVGMAIGRGRPWDQHDAARRTERLLLEHPTQDARTLSVARYHQAVALYFQGEVQRLHRAWGWLEDAEAREDLFLGSWLKAILAGQCVARGRTDTSREMCRRATQMWAAMEEMGESNLSICVTEVLGLCDASDGDGEGFDRLQEGIRWFDGSALGRVPFIICHTRCMRAAAALATAQMEAPGRGRREALLREAEACISTAARPQGPTGRTFVLPHYRNLSTLLSAGLSALRGDVEAARDRLDLGLEQMRDAGYYSVRSAHARRAKGLLLGGDEGDALVAEAEAELWGLGVEDPGRHARAILPGFPAARGS